MKLRTCWHKNKTKVNINFVEAENLTTRNVNKILKADAILVLVALEKEG